MMCLVFLQEKKYLAKNKIDLQPPFFCPMEGGGSSECHHTCIFLDI